MSERREPGTPASSERGPSGPAPQAPRAGGVSERREPGTPASSERGPSGPAPQAPRAGDVSGVLRRFLAATLGACVALVLTAPSAAAHGVGGVQPRNYETTLLRVEPRIPGVDLRVVDLGDALELTNTTRDDVVVRGYDSEPYLRVGPRGVFENRRSPATYLNRTLVPNTKPPASADSSASPVWSRVSGGQTAVWHDHRAHYMGTEEPPAVQRDPSARHVVDRWTIEMESAGRNIRASGELVWVPAPSPWPFAALAVVVAAVVLLLSRSRAWRVVFAVALSLLVVCAFAHVVGLWDATTASTGSKLAESAYSLVGVALGLFALAWMWRRGTDSAMPLVLVASIFLFFAGGLADVSTLGHSQIPTTFSPTLARVLVALDLGLGAGLAIAAAIRLRHPTATTSRASERERVTVPLTS